MALMLCLTAAQRSQRNGFVVALLRASTPGPSVDALLLKRLVLDSFVAAPGLSGLFSFGFFCFE